MVNKELRFLILEAMYPPYPLLKSSFVNPHSKIKLICQEKKQ